MVGQSTIAYLDCFSGVSGDMLLGALLDCGLDEQFLRRELAGLDLPSWELRISRCTRHGIGGVRVQVEGDAAQPLRTIPDITRVLETSRLARPIVERALRVFHRLAEAEARVHQIPVERIHFHEIGALDTIIDVVGVLLGFDRLGITAIHSAPLPLGRGFVRCAHGRLPLPAPAVCELLSGVPVYGVAAERELVTPTGAALVVELAEQFGPLPDLQLGRTGYGAGQEEGEERCPNLLRVLTGTPRNGSEPGRVEVIETHLDDWQTEGFPWLCDRLFAHHALDVSLTPMQMKKGRPGFCLRVIADPAHGPDIRKVILTETSSIGLRYRTEQRVTLPRRPVSVATRWGDIIAKQVETPVGPKIYPEYEACRNVAEQHRVPLDLVYREILARSTNGND